MHGLDELGHRRNPGVRRFEILDVYVEVHLAPRRLAWYAADIQHELARTDGEARPEHLTAVDMSTIESESNRFVPARSGCYIGDMNHRYGSTHIQKLPMAFCNLAFERKTYFFTQRFAKTLLQSRDRPSEPQLS